MRSTNLKICPFMTSKETTKRPDGSIFVKEIKEPCLGEGCPYYRWQDWNKPGQGCLKAAADIERMRTGFDI